MFGFLGIISFKRGLVVGVILGLEFGRIKLGMVLGFTVVWWRF